MTLLIFRTQTISCLFSKSMFELLRKNSEYQNIEYRQSYPRSKSKLKRKLKQAKTTVRHKWKWQRCEIFNFNLLHNNRHQYTYIFYVSKIIFARELCCTTNILIIVRLTTCIQNGSFKQRTSFSRNDRLVLWLYRTIDL